MEFVTPMERVLSEDMWHIREMILKYVIYQPGGSHFSVQDVRSCRLVRKAWLQSIASIFHKARTPLFQFKHDNTSKISAYRRPNNMIPQFIKHVLSSSLSEQWACPLGVTIWEGYCISDEEINLVRDLPKCKSGLTSLSIYYPNYPTPCLFALLSEKPWLFGNLHTLHVTFGVALASTSTRQGTTQTGSLSTALQSVLDATKSLKELQISLQFNPSINNTSGFETLVLPSTLTKIALSCSVDAKNLQMLTNSPLPNLTDLKLVVDNRFWDQDLMFRIMEHVKSTLNTLQINTVGAPSEPQIVAVRNVRWERTMLQLKVPAMKNLESLSVTTVFNMPIMFETAFRCGDEAMPNLKSLKLFGEFKIAAISEKLIQQWKSQGKVRATSLN